MVLSPVALLIAVAIKLTSRGPILYRQQRIGYQGRPFTMLKFRSMRVDNDPSIHRKIVNNFMGGQVVPISVDIQQDSRLTRVGGFLRRTCLDEIPQFVNVMRGEMSLVGPRPCVPYEYEEYGPQQRKRVDAMPGISGLWQVLGRGRGTFKEMIRMDLHYIENWSLLFDLKILMHTPGAILRAGRRIGSSIRSRLMPSSLPKPESHYFSS
jgi:lipopolysaccharide/colanic/teichoic acid biosynthesis glycosyltransferase